jgi:hypothetical protein
MFKSTVSLLALAALAALPTAAVAQEEKEAETYIYGTYFECDVTMQWRADEIAKTVWAPIYDAAVEEGVLTAWGWLTHHTGGKWRRAIYLAAPSMAALFEAQESLGKKITEKSGPGAGEFGRICGSHVDYVWKREAGSPPNQDRGEAGFSVYMVCDMAREDRADELVSSVMAPIYDRFVSEGKLTSWGWHSHIIGGKVRRLAVTTAKDTQALLKARGEILGELVEKHGDAMQEFGSICSSHQDYIWGIELETP